MVVPTPVKVTTHSPSAERVIVLVNCVLSETAQSLGKEEETAVALRGAVGGKLGIALTDEELPSPAKLCGVTLK